MVVPKQRRSKSRQGKRRMHIFLKKPIFGLCPKCGKPKQLHAICWNCGYYKGEEVVNVLEKLTKKEKKKREKEMKMREEEQKKGAAGSKPLSWEGLSRK